MDTKYLRSDSEESDVENTYCIFLHILEGVGLNVKENTDVNFPNQPIMLYASLNGVKFEVEGHCKESCTIFNSNFIWECELKDVKRIKTENRPIKLECFLVPNHSPKAVPRQIGALLLPLRYVPVLENLRTMPELIWIQLTALNGKWRQSKPELHLLLMIVKKSLVDKGHVETFLNKLQCQVDVKTPHSSETSNMLQSQDGLYVQLLEQEGLIQVGNNFDVDNDIFSVSLTFKQIEGLLSLCDNESVRNNFVFSYNFLGSSSKVEITANSRDVYPINEKVSLTFKSSMKSLRIYFQSVFYIPIKVFHNGILIAMCRFDFEKLLPDDLYFNVNNSIWRKNGSLPLMNKLIHINPPAVDYLFSLQLISRNPKKPNISDVPNQANINDKFAADLQAQIRQISVIKESSLQAKTMSCQKYSTMEEYIINQAELLALGAYQHDISANEVVLVNTSDEVIKVALEQKNMSPRSKENNNCGTEEESKDVIDDKTYTKDDYSISQNIEKNEENLNFKGNEISKMDKVEDVNKTQDQGELCPGSKQDVIENVSSPLVDTNEENAEDGLYASAEQDQSDYNEMVSSTIKDLELWKKQEELRFLKELEAKEEDYINELNIEWEKQRYGLQMELETKISKCEELNSKLQQAYYKLKDQDNTQDDAQVVKNDMEINYSCKLKELDEKIRKLQDEVEVKNKEFEIQKRELQEKNNDLLCENDRLSEHIYYLENQLQALHSENKEISDHNLQRINKLTKSKNYYKTQWINSEREFNKLQLSLLQSQYKHDNNRTGKSNVIELEDILNEMSV